MSESLEGISGFESESPGRRVSDFESFDPRGKDSFTRIGCNDPMQDETPLDAVRTCLEQFGRTLGIARSLVRAGKRVDLTGLDAEMGFVCARMLDLPPEESRILRPTLLGLGMELDALSTALTAQAPPSC